MVQFLGKYFNFNNVRLVQQVFTNDCGLACIKMVAAYHKLDVSLSELRVLANPDQQGLSMFDLVRLSRQIGLESIAVQLPLDGEGTCLADAPLPCILHWDKKHFVVLEKINGNHMHIVDPALGKVRLEKNVFAESWVVEKGFGKALICTPAADDIFKKASTRTGNGPVEHPLLERIKVHLKPHRSLLFKAFMSLFVLMLIQLTLPFLMQLFVDKGIEGQNIGFAGAALIGFFALSLSSIVFQWLQSWMLLYIGIRLDVGLMRDFMRGVLLLPTSFLDRNYPADLIQRFADHSRIESFVKEISIQAVFTFLSLLCFGLVLFVYHPGLLLLFLFLSGLGILLILRYLPKRKMLDNKMYELSANEQELLWEFVGHVDTVRMQGFQHRLDEHWMDIQYKGLNYSKEQLSLSMKQFGGASVINLVRDVSVSFFSAYLVINGEMTLGSLIAVQFIVGQLNASFQRIPEMISSAQDAFLSMERIESIGDFQSVKGGVSLDKPVERISVSDLSFKYKEEGTAQLKDLNFNLEGGSFVCIVGPSGCGKSSLLKIIAGLYEGAKGRIQLNGEQDISELNKKSYWSAISYSRSEDALLSFSLLENITMGKVLDQEWLTVCLQVTELVDLINELPQQVETPLGPQGVNLSMGQRQRILLARALYRKPSLLLLDEIPSALSEAQSIRIMENIRTLLPNTIIVLCSHSKCLVDLSDKVFLLNKGELVAEGNADKLYEELLVYRQLFI